MNAPLPVTETWNWQKNFRSSAKLSFLKVKIKYLAEEARIIKEETRKSRKAKRKLLAKGKPLNGLALAAEGLREHRLGVVRPAARESLLAYAFLRGMPYLRVENKTQFGPCADTIARVAWRFAVCPPNTSFKERTSPSWKEGSISGTLLQEIRAWLAAK